MMTEMTRYKHQSDIDEDDTSIGSARTEELGTGTTRIRYHMGSNYWRSRTNLEKLLMIGWVIYLVTIIILVVIIHEHDAMHRHEDISSHACVTRECIHVSSTVLNRMNLSIDPCEDFYEYSCGGWIASNTKPEGKPLWGTLNEINENNQKALKKALESTEKYQSESEEKARLYYKSCRDPDDTIEKRGAEPLLKVLKDIGGWALTGNWTAENFDLQTDIIKSIVDHNSEALFSWGVGANDKKSDSYVLQFDQGGLFLPSRKSYLNESEKAAAKAYVAYITKVGVLLGAPENESRSVAEGILSLETSLARITTPDEQRQDTERLYHNMTLKQLTEKAPFIDWTAVMNAAFLKVNRQLSSDRIVVVYAPEYLEKLTKVLENYAKTTEGNTTIHNYLTWHIVVRYLGYLSQDFKKAYSVLQKAQIGVTGWIDPWKLCVEATDGAFGDALGAMFVRSSFTLEAKEMAVEILSNIRNAFQSRLKSVSWMDPKTKQAAIEKAESIAQMIGYPDSILDPTELDKKYGDLQISVDKFFESNMNVTQHKIREVLNLLFKPVNRTRWGMTPPTVNAYYSPTKNIIVFPAGILQSPIFNKNNPLALNYGAVGVVMGHELSHAFDDEGRKYDKEGNMRTWWQQETTDQFKKRTQCMVSQYSSYSFKEEQVKGSKTLGENIADNGGLKTSLEAFKKAVNEKGTDINLVGVNMTSTQLFFVGFSQVWCSIMTKEVAHLEIMKDSHVPGKLRVKGTLSNSPEFSKAFNCPKGSPMNPENKCNVW